MANNNCNAEYDQIPRIVTEHPKLTLADWGVMICIYRVLKDKPIIIYSNEALAIKCQVSIKTIERQMCKLRKLGFLICTGRGYNRRILLGRLFHTTLTGEG